MVEEEIAKLYDESADDFYYSRSIGKELTGVQNRDIEQPIMFRMVPEDLEGMKLLDIGC